MQEEMLDSKGFSYPFPTGLRHINSLFYSAKSPVSYCQLEGGISWNNACPVKANF